MNFNGHMASLRKVYSKPHFFHEMIPRNIYTFRKNKIVEKNVTQKRFNVS